MRSILSIVVALCILVCSALSAYAITDLFSIRTDAPVQLPAQQSLSVKAGEVLDMPAQSLETWLGLERDRLTGITVTALPAPAQGALVLYGVEVDLYQYISREELDGLCFVPNEVAVSASLTLQPQGANNGKTRLEIAVLETMNAPPVVESASFSTMKNMNLSATLQISDPDGDTATVHVTRAPQKGTVAFTGHRFVYQPFQNATGSDSFAVVAIDRFGNYSGEATMDVKIESNRSGFAFVDMAGNPSEYAAFKLHDRGVFSGENIGGSWFFHPTRQMTRGEFLVALLAAAGMSRGLEPTVNTMLPGDSDLPLWMKSYIKKAVDESIVITGQPFFPDQIPTRAEAVALVAAAAKIHDVKDYDLSTIGDLASIADWSLPAYKSLAAYRMLDLHDGSAHPDRGLDNAYAADLLWQLYKHTHR